VSEQWRRSTTARVARFCELFPPDEYADAALLELGMRFAMALLDGVALRGLVIQPIETRSVELSTTVARALCR